MEPIQVTPDMRKRAEAPPPTDRPTAHPAGTTLCDGGRLLCYLRAGSAWLNLHVAQVNALNVFPVPDGDTGTNMSLTMRAALDEAERGSYTTVSQLASLVAHGALMGARGNSGVILSQILRGFARALDSKENLDARDLAQALREGAVTAYKGVLKPVEGTMLTVIREAAEAAHQAADTGASIEGVLASTLAEAERSLARTPSLLPVLAEAGVVDAGGQGLTLLLDGMVRHTRGEQVEGGAMLQDEVRMKHARPVEGRYNYDTQFVIQGHNLDVEAIRQQIAALGDSVMVVGDSQAVKVHVHSDWPGQVLDLGVRLGQVNTVIVENMQQQYEEFKAAQKQAAPALPRVSPATVAAQLGDISIISVVSGAGLQRVFESLGAKGIVPGGQTMNPSTQDLLRGIENAPDDKVILLPNNGNVILTARQAEQLAHKRVMLVPTRTIPQGIAALLAFNYQADLETNVAAMIEASSQVQTAEVTQAVRSAQVNGLAISAGQIIGLLNEKLIMAGESTMRVMDELLQAMRAEDYEIVTIYYGEDVQPEEAARAVEHVRQQYPQLEVEVVDGGQAYYYYIISAE